MQRHEKDVRCRLDIIGLTARSGAELHEAEVEDVAGQVLLRPR